MGRIASKASDSRKNRIKMLTMRCTQHPLSGALRLRRLSHVLLAQAVRQPFVGASDRGRSTMKTKVPILLAIAMALLIGMPHGYAWMASKKITSSDFNHDGNRFTIHAARNDSGNIEFRIHVYCNEENAEDGYRAYVSVTENGKTVFESSYSDDRPIDRTRKEGIIFKFEIAPQYLQEAGFNIMFKGQGYWAYLKEHIEMNSDSEKSKREE